MKNTKKIFMMLLLSASVLFFACNKDEEDKALTKEEVKAELSQLSNNMSMYMDEMQNSEGITSMQVLMNLDYPFNNNLKSDVYTDVFANINYFLTPVNPSQKMAFESEPFVFQENTGTYEWIDSLERWKVDPIPTDKIIIIFPSDTNNLDVNDAVLTIYNYTEDQIISFDSTYYNPTAITADLYVKDVKAIDLDLTATWITSGDMAGEPTYLNADVYIIPFDFHIDFAHESTSATVNVWIKDQGTQIFGVGLGAVYQNASDSIPANINGHVQLFNVKFQISADLNEIVPVVLNGFITGTLNTPDVLAEINGKIDAYVTIDDMHAADIEIAKIIMNPLSDELPVDIVFIYNDGTSESALPYFEDFASDLEDFFSFLDGFYDK